MYKIILDSCGEIPENLKNDKHFCNVALELEVDGYRIVDDETFDQKDFLRRVKESILCPKSSCPAPQAYADAFECDAQNIYVITLSGKLSGSYNSACLAKELYLEEHEDDAEQKNIYVFNSKSASIGETLIAFKIQEYENAGIPFAEICEKVEAYISEQRTFFVLESLDSLRKNGRLSNLKALVANTLNIKPVMGSTDEGAIQQLAQAIGMKKALMQMVKDVVEATKDCENKILAISHCNCPERAEMVKRMIEKVAHFKEIVILNTAGVSSLYASDGGIILAV